MFFKCLHVLALLLISMIWIQADLFSRKHRMISIEKVGVERRARPTVGLKDYKSKR